MNKLTAAEARELAGPTVEERVQEVLDKIKEVASPPTRARQLALHEPFWVNWGYYGTEKTKEIEDYRKAVKQLIDLGYKVEFYYKTHSIAVDMYTIVKW